MKLVEKKLRENMFRWDYIPGDDEDNLIKYLNETKGLNWVRKNDVKIDKLNQNTILRLSSFTNSVSFELKGKNSFKNKLPFLHDRYNKVMFYINGTYNCEFDIYGGRDYLNVYLEKPETTNILTVWFNAWRYEREEQFALIALMKTIAYAMGEHPVYKKVKPILLRGLEILTKGILHKLATDYVLTEKEVDEFEKKLSPKMEFLAEVDKDTIYFDGILKIEKEMNKILRDSENGRIVVFIDDLDRCSPRTVLEVFESIKVFLGLGGFVYVIGLSEQTINKFISAEYVRSGITDQEYVTIFAKQYTGKIIQIPIRIPEWNTGDIESLIEDLSKRLETDYSQIIAQNKGLLSKTIDLNPREVKRFINNFIIAYEIYSNLPSTTEPNIKLNVNPKELLVVQALRNKWPEFYLTLSSNSDFRKILEKFLDKPFDKVKEMKDESILGIELLNRFLKLDDTAQNVLKNEINSELWNIIKDEKDTIFKIEDWEIYRRAVRSVKKSPTEDEKPSMIGPEELFKEGYDHYKRGKYLEAIEKMDKALTVNPDYVEALVYKGRCLDKLQKYKEAIVCYDKALTIESNNVKALNGKGDALRHSGMDEAAIEIYDKALTIESNNVKALNGKGDALRHSHKYNEALEVFDKAIQIDPKNAEVLKNKGLVFKDLGQFEDAIRYFDEALSLNPNHARALRGKGDAFSRLGNDSEALKYIERALEIDPNYVVALVNKGVILDRLERYSEALKQFEKASSIDPSNQDASYYKKDTLRKMGWKEN
jgi:tetratricopeptide (TPR) repeat protein